MAGNVIDWHAKAGRAIGIGALDYTPTRIGQTLHLPCARGHRVDFTLNTRLPPEVLAKKLLQKGWTIGSRLLCPKHSTKTKAPTPAPQEEIEDMKQMNVISIEQKALQVPVTQATPASSDAARSAKRAAMQWLDEAFDVTKGQYNSGVSDDTIAKETGLAPAKVKELREEFYGALKVPSELDALMREMAGIYTRLEQMNAEHSARHEAIVAAANAIDARIESLAKLNGWKG